MKHTKFLIPFLSVAVLTVGCKPAAETTAVERREAVAEQEKDYAYAQRTEFIADMQRQLAEIGKDLDQLAAKVEASTVPAREEAKPKLQALRDQAAKLTRHLDDAKNATESTWNDVKSAIKTGYGEFKEGFQKARQWVSDKIAP